MTADAKVGLLLGLVFIVIIAFLVNGLPKAFQTAEPDDVVINTITPQPGPDLVIDERAMEAARQLEPQMVKRESQAPQDVVLLNPQGVQPVGPAEPVSPPVTVQSVSQVASAASQTAAAKQAEQAAAVQQGTFGNPVAADGAVQIPQQEAAVKGKVHVIQAGETLSSIAQKYYGKEQGKRPAVIQKLYEVNNKVLGSPNKVSVGDKLTIPSLTDLVGATAKAPDPSQKLANKFPTVLQPVKKEEQKQLSEYVVKKGDSLWSIAQQTLGDGKRYKEIMKANTDKLKDAGDVAPGMQLKIPK